MTTKEVFLPRDYKEKCKKHSDNKSYSFITLLIWTFFICCFIGFVVETIYSYIRKGHYINKQGLLYGPFKPIYGFGGVIFTIIFYKIKYFRAYVIFIIGLIAGTLYEYFCSYFQEYFLKSRSWDYSGFKYNLNGRISISHAVFWGILALLFVKGAMPLIVIFMQKTPKNINSIIAYVIAAFLSFDIFMSVCAVERHIERLKDVPASNSFESFLDEHYGNKKIEETFTHMKFVYVKKKSK